MRRSWHKPLTAGCRPAEAMLLFVSATVAAADSSPGTWTVPFGMSFKGEPVHVVAARLSGKAVRSEATIHFCMNRCETASPPAQCTYSGDVDKDGQWKSTVFAAGNHVVQFVEQWTLAFPAGSLCTLQPVARRTVQVRTFDGKNTQEEVYDPDHKRGESRLIPGKWADLLINDRRLAQLRSDKSARGGETVVSGLRCERVSGTFDSMTVEGCLLKDPSVRTPVEGVELQGVAVSLTASVQTKPPRFTESRVEAINPDLIVPAGVFEVPADVHMHTRHRGSKKPQAGAATPDERTQR